MYLRDGVSERILREGEEDGILCLEWENRFESQVISLGVEVRFSF